MNGVIPAKAGIQYAAALVIKPRWLWNTGSSAFADDDSCEYGGREPSPPSLSHHRVDPARRRVQVAEFRAADFDIAVLVERRAVRRPPHQRGCPGTVGRAARRGGGLRAPAVAGDRKAAVGGFEGSRP